MLMVQFPVLGTRGAHTGAVLCCLVSKWTVRVVCENFLMKLRVKGPHRGRVLGARFLFGNSRGSHTRFFFVFFSIDFSFFLGIKGRRAVVF